MSEKNLVEITKNYYDSKEADEFYFHVWGGEDIHIGIYDKKHQSIKEASRNTVLKMVKKIPPIKKNSKILDIGSGYGGAARYLAKKYGCKVDCLNLSETENERNRELTKKAELDELVTVTMGNFEKIPFERESYDIVWSQDALLHSNRKEKVFREVARVLKPEGRFIFTDPMQSDDCPDGALKDVLPRIHLEELGSVRLYRRLANRADLERVLIKEMPGQLVKHYTTVLETLNEQYDTVVKKSSEAYIKNMITGLKHWIEAGEKGYLNWGILQFQKRNI